MQKLASILVCLLLGACSPAWHADPRMSPVHRAALQAAADEWDQATGGEVHYDFVWDDPDWQTADRNVYQLSQVPEFQGRWDHCFAPLRPNFKVEHLQIYTQVSNPDMVRLIALHEIGHAAGLEHVAVDGAIMSPNGGTKLVSPNDDVALTGPGCLTEMDLAEFRRVRHHDVSRPANPLHCVL